MYVRTEEKPNAPSGKFRSICSDIQNSDGAVAEYFDAVECNSKIQKPHSRRGEVRMEAFLRRRLAKRLGEFISSFSKRYMAPVARKVPRKFTKVKTKVKK